MLTRQKSNGNSFLFIAEEEEEEEEVVVVVEEKISSPSLFLSISSLVRSHVPVRQHRDIELYVQNSKIRV